MAHDDLAAHARALLEANVYLTLSTVDSDGHPWASPVYFAYDFSFDGLLDVYWTSTVDARHSRNVAVHPGVSFVVFDSRVLPYHGRAVYGSAVARELADDDLDRGLEIYPGPAWRGGSPLAREAVTGSSPYRLYGARASEVSVLCPREPRQPCRLHGIAFDHRAVLGTRRDGVGEAGS